MIKVVHVDVEHIKNETCKPDAQNPEGRFPRVFVEISNGNPNPKYNEILMGKTCACGEGHVTYGTWRLPPEGMIFQDVEALKQYMMKNDAYANGHAVLERMAPVERTPFW